MRNHLRYNMNFITKAMAAVAVCLLIAGVSHAQQAEKPGSSQMEAGIQDRSVEAEISVYPNPSTGVFTLKTSEDAQVQVYSNIMHPIQPKMEMLMAGERRIDMTSFEDGLYFVHVRTQTGESTVQLFKR